MQAIIITLVLSLDIVIIINSLIFTQIICQTILLWGGGYGVSISLSDHNKFINVSADFNEEYGIGINGWYNTFNNIEVKNNFDTGIDVYKGYNNITNSKILYNDKYGIILTHSADFSNIINNNISNNGITNLRMKGDVSQNINSVIRDNIISHASIGILMRGESTDGIENHLIVNNTFSYHSTRHILLEYAHNNNFWMNSFFGTKIEFRYTNNNNNWNNTQTGNFWSDYPYSDGDDDGIGDLPYDLGDGNFDFLPIWRDGPEISILAPTQDLMTSNAPNFIIETHDPSLDSMWYTLNINTTKYFFDSNSTIDLNVWQSLQDGNNTFHFYANDTFGNINSEDVTVIKDTSGPVISLLNPIDSHAYNLAPHFNISFQDLSFNSSWYTINNELTNYFFSGNSGYINQTKWNSLSQGIVQIIFYANDSFNQISNYSISIIKDTEAPLLTINSPTDGATFGTTPPIFNISVFDYSLNLTWFTIDGLSTIFPFTGDVFSLDQDTWNSLPQGNINITFYAKDSLGRVSAQSIIIRKEIPSEDSIPGVNLAVLIGVVISVFIVLIRRLKHEIEV